VNEAERQEGLKIRELNPICNGNIPGRTKEEKLDSYNETKRKWYARNIEREREYQRTDYAKNIEKHREYQRKHYNKDIELSRKKINESNKCKIVCECGMESNRGHIARHRQTKMHKERMEQKEKEKYS
jgi:hypothetical protein